MPRIRAADRRLQLRAAALSVIGQEGVHSATTRAIVTEAGMSLASFHYAYASRDELLREVIREVIDDYQGVEFAVDLSGPKDLESVLERALHAYLDLVITAPRREQGMLELTLYAMRHQEEMGQLPGVQYQAYYTFVEHLLERISVLSGTEWAEPIPVLARIIVALTDGLTLAYLATSDREALDAQVGIIAAMLAARVRPIAENPESTD